MKLNKSIQLIILCWLVYTSSYIGRLSYNANIVQIREYFNVSYNLVAVNMVHMYNLQYKQNCSRRSYKRVLNAILKQ